MTTPAERLGEERDAVGVAAFTASDYRPGEVIHVVLFRFGPDVTAAQREDVKRRFLALGTECRRDGRHYIRDIAAGSPNGGEGAERGFEQGFVLRFASEGDRNFYVGAPVVADEVFQDAAHGAFKRFAGPFLASGPDGVLVFDFKAERP